MEECRFLSSAELSDQIRRVCDADSVDCAVAFWGRDMRDALFPRWPEQTVRIVCDIAMQGTPRSALEQLGAPNNPRLTVRDGLHAKVFVSSHGAVICSANASGNGVGRTRGKAGKLIEAGIFCPTGSRGHGDAAAFVAHQFDTGRQVDEDDLKRAALWGHEPRLPTSDETLGTLGLLERLRQHPERFANVSIAIADEEMDEDVVEEQIESYNREHDGKQELTESNIFLQADKKALRGLNSSVIVIYKEPGARKGTVSGFVRARPYPDKRPKIVIGEKNWKALCRNIAQADLKKTLTPDEWKKIGKLLKKEDWLFTPEQFAETLRSVETDK